MALIDKKILTPIRHHQDNANTVIGQASTMKALFDQGAEDLRVKLNGVIDELLATTGAQQIGIDPARGLGNTLADALTSIKAYMNLGASGISATTIGTGSGNNVQSQLEWLLLQIQNVLLNQIPDGTITMQKLATALANTINDNASNIGDLTALTTTEKTNLVGAVNELVSESAQVKNHAIFITRDISLGGVQTITLPFKAKGMTVISAIPNTKNESTAVWAENGTQISRARRGSDDLYIVSSNVIRVYLNADNYISGVVQNVTETGFEILWTKTGSPTGTVNTVILASSYADGGA